MSLFYNLGIKTATVLVTPSPSRKELLPGVWLGSFSFSALQVFLNAVCYQIADNAECDSAYKVEQDLKICVDKVVILFYNLSIKTATVLSTPSPSRKELYLGGWALFPFLRCRYFSMRFVIRLLITASMIVLTT